MTSKQSQALRFGTMTVLSFVVNVGGAALLYGPAGLPEELAYALSLVAVMLMNFALMRWWVFPLPATERPAAGKQFLGYLASAAGFRGAEYLAFLLLHTWLGLPPLPTIVGVSIASLIGKFAFYGGRVFGRRTG